MVTNAKNKGVKKLTVANRAHRVASSTMKNRGGSKESNYSAAHVSSMSNVNQLGLPG